MIFGNCCGLDDLPGGLPENATELLGFNEPDHWCALGVSTPHMFKVSNSHPDAAELTFAQAGAVPAEGVAFAK